MGRVTLDNRTYCEIGFRLKGYSHLIKRWYITGICHHVMISGGLTSWSPPILRKMWLKP